MYNTWTSKDNKVSPRTNLIATFGASCHYCCLWMRGVAWALRRRMLISPSVLKPWQSLTTKIQCVAEKTKRLECRVMRDPNSARTDVLRVSCNKDQEMSREIMAWYTQSLTSGLWRAVGVETPGGEACPISIWRSIGGCRSREEDVTVVFAATSLRGANDIPGELLDICEIHYFGMTAWSPP